MTAEERKIWWRKETERLINYQHQHRGLRFLKLLLPPSRERKVNLVGLDNHIYRGNIPKVPEDQLPPEVDEKSIDEDALYKEIRDINFPTVPLQEPLGPRRRIEGTYTLAKKLSLAPVEVICDEGLEETQILGFDGGIYKGTEKYSSVIELNKQLRGTKRIIKKTRQQSSSRGFVEPTPITLQAERRTPYAKRYKKSVVELPVEQVSKIIELVLSEKKKVKKRDVVKKRAEVTRGEAELQKMEESEAVHTDETEEAESIKAGGIESDSESESRSDTGTEESEETEESQSKDESEDEEYESEEEEVETKDMKRMEITKVEKDVHKQKEKFYHVHIHDGIKDVTQPEEKFYHVYIHDALLVDKGDIVSEPEILDEPKVYHEYIYPGPGECDTGLWASSVCGGPDQQDM